MDINMSKAIIIWIFKRMIVVVIEIIVLETKYNYAKNEANDFDFNPAGTI